MTGLDYDYRKHWEPDFALSQFSRKKPVRLRDREALRAIITEFRKRAGDLDAMVWIDEVQYDDLSDVDALLDLAPPEIRVLHLQSRGPNFLTVRLTSWQGGQTWVTASTPEGHPDQEALHRLMGLVESVSRPLGPRRFFSRFPVKKVQRWSPSVVSRVRRDELDARRVNWRIAIMSSLFGFAAGILGGLLGGGGLGG
jgi:hypothetical protein